jgi:hypothetical protein
LIKLKTKENNQEKREGDKGQGGVEEKGAKKVPEIHPEIQEMLKLANRGMAAPKAEQQAPGDNSNTQFAALALWVVRRYGMPVQPALIRLEKRYRATQLQDGSWNYLPGFHGSVNVHYSPAMTCAGLIGLAVGHGAAVEIAKEKPGVKVVNPDKDNNLQAGFRCLGSVLQEYGQIRDQPGPGDRGFYFLWSLERVAEIYGMKTIGRIDWYDWGSRLLLASQQVHGGWYGKFSPSGVDTCFALLFLVRANVAKDLTVTLRGRLRDPGTRTLKAGGVGADAMRKKEEKVAEASDKKSVAEKEPPDLTKKSSPTQLVDPKEKLAIPPAPPENEDAQAARKMSDELVAAKAPQQEELLGKYKESKGSSYTLALAGAIPRLSGESKTKARYALAERLTRMTADTLRAELKDDDPEIRRAASLACAMKDDKSHIPDLIPLIDDPEPLVSRAAHAALTSLANQDFGPAKDASAKDRAQAIEAWRNWWAKQERK